MTAVLFRTCLIAFAASAALSACAQPSDSCSACDVPPAGAAPPEPDLPIRETANPITIDGSLDEWPTSHVVLSMTPDEARDSQWRCIRDRCPALLSERDAGVTASLAWSRDPFVLYGAFDLFDDVIVPSRYPDRPYSGDSVEIFLAADRLDYPSDYYALVAAPRSVSQSAFAQIDIGPAPVRSLADYVQDYRTDSRFKTTMMASGFAVATRIDDGRWRAEVRIPLNAFAKDIASRLQTDGARLAIGLTYVDYDDPTRAPDPALAADSYGYKPDNVFSTAIAESGVNAPARMRRAYLAK